MKQLVSKRYLILACFTTTVLYMFIITVLSKNSKEKILNWKFDGIIDSVRYDENEVDLHDITKPYVIIKGKSYHLDYYTWDFGYKIHKGDSIVKKENSMDVTLIKQNGKIYIFGNKENR